MPGSSIICWADAGAAVSADRIASAPKNLNVVIGLLRVSTQGAGRQGARLAFAPRHSRNADHGWARTALRERRVGKGALARCPPFICWRLLLWWARHRTHSRPAPLPTLRFKSKQRRHLPYLE